MIIFGYRSMAKLLAMVTLVCDRCGNPAANRIVQHTRWFTLFFIPLVPVTRSRTRTCTYCGITTRLSKARAEELMAHAGVPSGPLGPAQEQLPSPRPPAQG